MCGICGAYNLTNTNPVSPGLLRCMCDVMKHRGPDEDGYYVDGNVGLGMRRLKIIDLSTGSQPIFNEDKSVVVVFNGEIYNFAEIRELLIKRGHRFYTQTDTEVIVHLYEDFGESFVTFLNGMFAIALWDKRRQQLLLIRDRLGEKPLHYRITNDGIVFASEIKSIVCDPRFRKEIDREALYHYFTFHYIPAPLTIYRGVEKLPPGHYLRYRNGEVVVRKYWDFSHQPDYSKSEDYFSERLYELLSDSVRMRLVSDVPLGAFLSGGIDSTVVVGLMAKFSNRPVKSFSIGFKEKEYSELDSARIVAQRFNTEHHEFVVEPSAVNLVNKLAWHFDEPFNDSSAIPTFIVSELARRYVTVCLSGDGGDELFAGYDSYRRAMARRKLSVLPQGVRNFFAHKIGGRLPAAARGKAFLQALSLDDARFMFLGLSEMRKGDLFSEDFVRGNGALDSFSVVEKYLPRNSQEYLSRFMFVDAKLYLPDDILVKVDRMTMANSLESRAPFLDHRLVEFAATIPVHLKMNRSFARCVSKYVLKKSMRDIIPAPLLNRKKRGFLIPLDVWFCNELREMVLDILSPGMIGESGFFNVDYVLRTLKEHLVGRKNHRRFLWGVLMFLLWYQVHYKGTMVSV